MQTASLATLGHLFFLLSLSLSTGKEGPEREHEYCVVGAGPGGLQMGYFLKSAGHDYVIFEKSGTVGNFFTTYPRHRTLISINKRFTGKTNHEFNLRHDWNSLISDDESLLFTKYSDQLFPQTDDYLRYLSDYHTKLGLNVQFNTEISGIKQKYVKTDGFVGQEWMMHDQNGTVHNCRYLVIATGIAEPNIPDFLGINYTEGYETVSIDPKDFEGQRVLILGRGNSAFETAAAIYGATSHIHMVARSRVRLSWSTHYVGDLRAVNNALLDTYQLKSLDAVLEATIKDVELKKVDGKIFIAATSSDENEEFDNFALRESYDRVIRCLGFKFDTSIFHRDLLDHYIPLSSKRLTKYPPINHAYESTIFPGMFFVGTNTHSLDFRKSAGGFIHGYRYTARALHKHLEWRNHRVPWPSIELPITELINLILRRINEASGNYQMFTVLGDVFLLKDGGKRFVYLEEVPIKLLHNIPEKLGHESGPMILWVYQYGANFSGPGKDVFRLNRAVGDPVYAYESNFLHPVFYYYKDKHPFTEEDMKFESKQWVLPRPDRIHHIIEDFLTLWDAPLSHLLPLRTFIESCVGFDLRTFFDETCFDIALTSTSLPLACQNHYMQENGLSSQQVPV